MKTVQPPHKMPADFLSILGEFIERECGIVLREDKAAYVSGVIQERMRRSGAADPWEYIRGMMNAPPASEERKHLIANLVVGETSFFRSPEQFRIFQDHLLPSFLAAGVAVPLPVWSSGCATGEEPYSIAIASLEAFRGRFVEPVRILATDIHPEFLETARKGVYPPYSVKNIPPLLLMKYFTTLPDGNFRVKEEVRRLVTFEEKNLAVFGLAPPLPSRFMAIFCRNVMIYFRPDTTRRIVKGYYESLFDRGVLFLGHSETLWGISDTFRLERRDGAFFYRRPEGSRGPEPVPPAKNPAPASPADGGLRKPAPHSPSEAPSEGTEAPSPYLAIVERAETLADRGLLDEAEHLCGKAIELNPSNPEAFHLLSVVLRCKGRISEALARAEQAHSADDRFVLAVVEIAECLSLQGRHEEASACWEEAFRILEGPVRFPSLTSGTGLTAKALREYVEKRILHPICP